MQALERRRRTRLRHVPRQPPHDVQQLLGWWHSRADRGPHHNKPRRAHQQLSAVQVKSSDLRAAACWQPSQTPRPARATHACILPVVGSPCHHVFESAPLSAPLPCAASSSLCCTTSPHAMNPPSSTIALLTFASDRSHLEFVCVFILLISSKCCLPPFMQQSDNTTAINYGGAGTRVRQHAWAGL